MSNFVEVLFSLPKTIFFNMKYFNLRRALKLPVLISRKTRLKNLGGKVIIDESLKTFGVRIGFGDVGIFDKKTSWTVWQVSGVVIFKGEAKIGHGSKISVEANGNLEFGNDFCISAESAIICSKEIIFGDDVLISWNNLIMDTDFHDILDVFNNIINPDKKVKIGDHTWIGCGCTLLKGTAIPNHTVVAANTTITSSIKKSNTIIGGSPPKVLKEGINWIQ